MKKLQNTLYVTNPDAYLSLDGENVVVRTEDGVASRCTIWKTSSASAIAAQVPRS